MKKIFIFLLVLGIWQETFSQNIVQYQYWYDNNYADKTDVNLVSGTVLDLTTDLMTYSGLDSGFHLLHFRVKSDDGKWSTTISEQFRVTASRNVVQYQYWYDANYAGKTEVSVPTTGILDLNTALTTDSGLDSGLHTLHFRVKNNGGKWSTTISEQFSVTASLNVVQYQYWYDSNYAGKTEVSVPATGILDLNTALTTDSGFDSGLHTLHFRVKNSGGKWSTTVSEQFRVKSSLNVVQYQYWYDSNFAGKTEVSVPTTAILDLNTALTTDLGLLAGIHTLHFRIKNNGGKWSSAFSEQFRIPSTEKIMGYTYWFDDNYAGRTFIAIATTNVLDLQPYLNTLSVNAGNHILHFSAKSTLGKYSTTVSQFITVYKTYYQDFDTDGFGNNNVSVLDVTQPVGYVMNNTDCDDTNALVYQTGFFFVDADNDGFNNGAPAAAVCYGATPPTGYTLNNIGTDCDDLNAEVHPNHVEVLNNGIDDNCSGMEDETATTPTSYLYAAVCGTMLSSFNQVLYAYQVAGAEGYRFEITNGTIIRTIDTTLNSFTLAQLTGTNFYAVTYTIRVAVKMGGFYRAYGTPCVVTSPLVPSTSSIYGCGSTLASFWATIYASPVAAATGYRFRVTKGAEVRTFETSVSRFSLAQLSGTNVYGTTYTVDVALRFGMTWAAEYSPACSITTPANPPTTRLIVSQCGATISNLWATLYANPSSDAVSYRFEVVNGAQTRFFDTPNPRFSLMQLSGGAVANTVYTVRVAIFYGGVYQAFGPACTITTSPAATRGSATDVAIFEANAYPNPFADTFQLDINTSSEGIVVLKVYDMLGRLVEQRNVALTELGSLQVGNNYPSGVYNIVVTQGTHVKTLRVIKR